MESHLQLSVATKPHGDVRVLQVPEALLDRYVRAMGNSDFLHQGSVYDRFPLTRRKEGSAPTLSLPRFPVSTHDVEL